MINEWLLSGIRISLPLLFAALGGMFSERSGVANIALEAFLLTSSFVSAAMMATTHNLPLSLGVAVLATVFIGALFSFFTVKTKSDQIIVGMAFNILATGIIPVLCKAFYNTSGQTPSLSLEFRINNTPLFIALGLLSFFFTVFIFRKTVFGLHVTAAGDYPPALRTQGVNVDLVRYKAILVGAVIASIGGIYLSLGAGSGYTRNMSAGRGFIALAALIFGKWKPIPTFLACLFFGLLDALQIFLQSTGAVAIPTQLVQALPYVFTLIALAFFSGKSEAPHAINRSDL